MRAAERIAVVTAEHIAGRNVERTAERTAEPSAEHIAEHIIC